MKKKIYLYDTTLRDGAQGEGISFSLQDKIKVAKMLDSIGIDYIEGGWPGSNPKDILFFKEIKKAKLKHSKVAAFGSTRYKDNKPETDPNLKAIINVKPEVVCIFGKSWDLHVKCALRTTLTENLNMIYDSLTYLKNKGFEVIYDAEHFFDGFKADKEYALATLKQAEKAHVDNITLADTNGGTLPSDLIKIIKVVKKQISTPLGIHTHNDSDLAVANSIVAVEQGCILVQGTINGYGERCGNANLCSIIPTLQLKMGLNALPKNKLQHLTGISRYIDEIANQIPKSNQPYVGNSAFSHKGGIHISAVEKHSSTYEHISPELVGNKRRILLSELSGKTALIVKAKEFNIDFGKDDKKVKELLKNLKELEHQGYQFEGAEGSFSLIMRKYQKGYPPFFELEGFRVIVEKDSKGNLHSEATIKVKVKNKYEHTAAEGDGPVNALDNALRKALEKFYPQLKQMRLSDFKVRVIDATKGTRAKVRVLIESRDKKEIWNTIGVSENIIEASWHALVDSVEYKLLKG